MNELAKSLKKVKGATMKIRSISATCNGCGHSWPMRIERESLWSRFFAFLRRAVRRMRGWGGKL